MNQAQLSMIEDAALDAASACQPLAEHTLALVSTVRDLWLQQSNDLRANVGQRAHAATVSAANAQLQARLAALEAALPDPDLLERAADDLSDHTLHAQLRSYADTLRAVLAADCY